MFIQASAYTYTDKNQTVASTAAASVYQGQCIDKNLCPRLQGRKAVTVIYVTLLIANCIEATHHLRGKF